MFCRGKNFIFFFVLTLLIGCDTEEALTPITFKADQLVADRSYTSSINSSYFNVTSSVVNGPVGQLSKPDYSHLFPQYASLNHPDRQNVYTFANLDPVGNSQLVRGAHGISMSLHTTGIEAGQAVTVWFVVFNEPDLCETSPCGETDIFDPQTKTDVIYAAGNVVGNGGKVNFAGHLAEGDNSKSIMDFFNALLGLDLPSVGLIDAKKAEVHLVVRTHQDVIPEYLPDMIKTFNGGCTYPPGVPAVYGIPGPNTCSDIQFSIHQSMY